MALTTEELQRIHHDAVQRLRAAEIEEEAIVRRWTEVHCTRTELVLSIRRIEAKLLEQLARYKDP